MVRDVYDLTVHEAAAVFPSASPEEFLALKRKIIQHSGVDAKHPIIVQDGKILDGRSRYRICAEFKLPYAVEEFTGDDVMAYLLHTHTRTLSEPQRALAGAFLKKGYRALTRANQAAGGKGEALISPRHARNMAAEQMKISPRLITSAEAVVDCGYPQLIEWVRDGLLSVSRAADLTRLDEDTEIFVIEVGRRLDDISAQVELAMQPEYARIAERQQEQKRTLDKYYREKNRNVGSDINIRLDLVDSEEEKEALRQERRDARKRLHEFQDVKREKIELLSARALNIIQKKRDAEYQRLAKKLITEYAHLFADREGYDLPHYGYAVYPLWTFELGQIKLQAVAEEIVDDEKGILTLASGHRIRPEEVIQGCRTKAQASVIAANINVLNLGSERNILRPNSRLQRYWARVHAEFAEKAKD